MRFANIFDNQGFKEDMFIHMGKLDRAGRRGHGVAVRMWCGSGELAVTREMDGSTSGIHRK